MNCENFIWFNRIVETYLEEQFVKEEFNINQDTLNFLRKIKESIGKAHIFEIEDSIKRLLLLTKTPIRNSDIHLPFDSIFLDVSFEKDDLQNFGLESEFDKVIGIAIQSIFIGGEENVLGRTLMFIISGFKNEKTAIHLFYGDIDLNNKIAKLRKKSISVNPKISKVINLFFLNFINFINNPEVEYIEKVRSNTNQERRMKKGLPLIPNTSEIIITGNLRRYLNNISDGNGAHFSYRFWVRGHFKRVRLKTNKIEIRWIMPYIKGQGMLIEKTYRLQDNRK